MGRGRCVARAALAVLVLGSTGCSALGIGGGPPPAAVSGRWAGYLEIEGQQILGTLAISQSGRDLGATFVSNGLLGQATGKGRIDSDGRVALRMAYRTQCDGKLTLSGLLEANATRMTGSVAAEDCTGKARGGFTFSRR